MAPIHYAYKLCITERKSRKIFPFDFVYRLWLSCSQKCLFKVKGYNVFLYQNIIMHYKYLNHNLRTFVDFLDQSIYALFRPAPRIFTFVPPCPSLLFTPSFEAFGRSGHVTHAKFTSLSCMNPWCIYSMGWITFILVFLSLAEKRKCWGLVSMKSMTSAGSLVASPISGIIPDIWYHPTKCQIHRYFGKTTDIKCFNYNIA